MKKNNNKRQSMVNNIIKLNDFEIYTSEKQSKIMFIFPDSIFHDDNMSFYICVPATGKDELLELLKAIDGKEDFFVYRNNILSFDRENEYLHFSIHNKDTLGTTSHRMSEPVYVNILNKIHAFLQ